MATPKFAADDGRLFGTAAEANNHDHFTRAQNGYNRARLQWVVAIVGRCQTADRHPFKFTFCTYHLPVSGDWPYIKSISFSLRDCELDDNDRVRIRERVSDSQGHKYQEYHIEELYSDRTAAQAKLLEYQVQAINNLVKEANETAALLERGPIAVIIPPPPSALLDTDQSPPPLPP